MENHTGKDFFMPVISVAQGISFHIILHCKVTSNLPELAGGKS